MIPQRLDDLLVAEVEHVGPSRTGTDGDDRVVEADLPLTGRRARHRNHVRVDEPRRARQESHVVALQLVAHDVHLLRHDLARLGPEVLDGDVLLDAVAGPVVLAMAQTGEVQHGFAHRLGGNRSRVDAHTPEHVGALDDGGTTPELRRRDRRLLARRA